MAEDPFLLEISRLIVEALRLEEIEPEDIDPDAPLFGEGLGLDSIDALELALAVSQRYGVTLSSEDPEIRSVFSSLRNLATYIRSHCDPGSSFRAPEHPAR